MSENRFEITDDGYYDKLSKITYVYDKEIIQALMQSLWEQTIRFEMSKQEFEQKVVETLQSYRNHAINNTMARVVEELADDLGVNLE